MYVYIFIDVLAYQAVNNDYLASNALLLLDHIALTRQST